MRYRRAFIPGGSFFFTVVTERRRPVLATAEAVEVLRMALRAARGKPARLESAALRLVSF